MIREDVFQLINGEREYQNRLMCNRPEAGAKTSVAAWLIYMEKHLADAKQAIYNLDENGALEHVRKVTGLGVACMEYNNTLPRNN